MPSTISSAPSLPADAAAFVVENEAADDLRAVLALARHIFPTAPISPRLEVDAEMDDEFVIVMEVDATGIEVTQLVEAQRQWSEGLFSCCPSKHAHLFCLRMA